MKTPAFLAALRLPHISVASILTVLSAAPSVVLAQSERSDFSDLLQRTGASKDHLSICLSRHQDAGAQSAALKACLLKEKDIEEVVVVGDYLGIETPGVEGSAYLDRNYIDAVPVTNGDINEIVALLPGVQLSNDAFTAEAQQEIKAPEISISGGQPWQTGFLVDGMNYNSRQDPGASDRSLNAENDVQGGVQTMTLNTAMVAGVKVYDNNIPVEYGDFSGGVVEVDTVNAFSSEGTMNISVGYRGTQSGWRQYHVITAENGTEPNAPAEYRKDNYSVQAHARLNQHHGWLFSMNALSSTIDQLSFQQPKITERRNINGLVKYSYRNGWVDHLDAQLLYAPYENRNFRKDVLDSEFTVTGGAMGAVLNLKHDFSAFRWTSKLNVNQSENSREAAPHNYLWLTARGRDWGRLADSSEGGGSSVSRQGGHGDLEKVQTTVGFKNKLDFHAFNGLGVIHNAHLGFDITHELLERERKRDSYNYRSPYQYSTLADQAPLNCSGYRLDCVELMFHRPLSVLEAELGEALDFLNPDHLAAYRENVATTPQYFQRRLVRPEEYIEADITRYGGFAANAFEWGRTEWTLGLRADYNDFFKQINIAPRLSFGWDLFDDDRSTLILGANRYYNAGLLTYRIREQQRPAYEQYRSIRNGYLQGWQRESAAADFRYRYTDVDTPFDDEGVIGWKQTTQHFGQFSIKYIHREKRDQLARLSETVLGDDGIDYIQVNNAGSGHSDRVSFSWNAQYGRHSLWFNASYMESQTNIEGYDARPDQVAADQRVFLGETLTTRADINLLNSNFARPVTANLGWSSRWDYDLTTSLTGSYSQGFETAVATGQFRSTDDIVSSCTSCEAMQDQLPVYQVRNVKSRFLLNLSLKWNGMQKKNHGLALEMNVSNLLNARTHAITEGSSGIEPGRQFWLGVNYKL